MNPCAIYALRISETWVQLSAFVSGPGARARGASDSRQDAGLVCQCEGEYEKDAEYDCLSQFVPPEFPYS
jgi:hypothetical protein